MYQPSDRWVWDFWLVHDDSFWHMFHLQAPKTLSPEQRHWHATVGHAVSRNLIDWTPRATALEMGMPGSWDDTAIWTGSVIRHHSGRWQMAYTGIAQEDGDFVERIGLAWSDDLDNWEKDPSNPVLESDPQWYEQPGDSTWQHGWRDPFLVDLADDGYAMLLSARILGASNPYGAGTIAVATSPDGMSWVAQPPLPGIAGHFAQLEVPQLIKTGSQCHLIFCTNSDGPWPRDDPGAHPKIGTGEFLGPHLFGPFAEPPTFIDADEDGGRYAGRIIRTETDGYALLAFLDGDADSFRGGVSDPIPVVICPDTNRFRLMEDMGRKDSA